MNERETVDRIVALLADADPPPDAAARQDAWWEIAAAAEADGHGTRAQARIFRKVTRTLGWDRRTS